MVIYISVDAIGKLAIVALMSSVAKVYKFYYHKIS